MEENGLKRERKERLERMYNSLYAGLCISIGCVAYMKTGRGLLGAVLFSLGLLTVMALKYDLYTGKTCRLEWVKKPFRLIGCLIGNVIGCLAASLIFRDIEGVKAMASSIVSGKLMRTDAAVLSSSVLCGILIAIAVKSGEAINAIFAVMIFILCGAEHIVADAFYFITAGVFDLKFFLLVLIGNTIGGMLFLEGEKGAMS